MTVLALETATRAGSVAVMDERGSRSRPGDAARTHGSRLPNELLDCLAEAGRSLHDVDLFAVVAGPGSFTGLRVGVAAIQGLALAAGKRVVVVPTLEAMALAWRITHADAPATIAVACLDAQRGQVFYGAWHLPPDRPLDAGAPVVAPAVGTPAEFAAAVAALPAESPLVIVGADASAHAEILGARAGSVIPVPMPLAEVAARIAYHSPDSGVAPHAVRPLYIRRPDAELARERRGQAEPLEIARATPDDLSAVAALQQRTFTNPWAADAMRWELEHTDVARLYVARTTQRVLVAYCACWMVFDELHINSLAVEPECRRRGIARQMLTAVFTRAVAEGARSATLEVRRSNDAARALYEGLGFRVEAVRRDYYQNPREDALILWHRQLAGATPEP